MEGPMAAGGAASCNARLTRADANRMIGNELPGAAACQSCNLFVKDARNQRLDGLLDVGKPRNGRELRSTYTSEHVFDNAQYGS